MSVEHGLIEWTTENTSETANRIREPLLERLRLLHIQGDEQLYA